MHENGKSVVAEERGAGAPRADLRILAARGAVQGLLHRSHNGATLKPYQRK